MPSALAGLDRNADPLAELGQAEERDARPPRRRSAAAATIASDRPAAAPDCGAAGTAAPRSGPARPPIPGRAAPACGGSAAPLHLGGRRLRATSARRRRAARRAGGAGDAQLARLLEPAVPAAGAAHLASGRPDRAVRHDIAGLAGRTGEDHRYARPETGLTDSKHGGARHASKCRDFAALADKLEARARRAVPWLGRRCSGGEAASERERFDRPVRECRPALRHGRGDPVRPQLLAAAKAASTSSPARRARARRRLLKLLYLALRPSRGLIRLFGEDIVTMPRDAPARLPPPDRRRLPGIPAGPASVGLRQCRAAAARRRASTRRISRRRSARCSPGSGSADRASARPATLSGGEQQRVAIARAVIGRPELLVADEPTGNVDPEMAQRLLHLFDSLNKLGTTVVVATHDLHLHRRASGAPRCCGSTAARSPTRPARCAIRRGRPEA